jgi:hypothetical protein
VCPTAVGGGGEDEWEIRRKTMKQRKASSGTWDLRMSDIDGTEISTTPH